MIERATVKPGKGRRVRHESGAPVEDGDVVELTPFYRRRLDDGDLILVEIAAEPTRKDKHQ